VLAFVFGEMGCVVVGRDERDMAVMRSIKEGWRPEKKKKKERKNAGRSGGVRGAGIGVRRCDSADSADSNVVHGRGLKEKNMVRVRVRVNEKATVIAKLREEKLMDNMGDLRF
jgi:hypothetical protein